MDDVVFSWLIFFLSVCLEATTCDKCPSVSPVTSQPSMICIFLASKSILEYSNEVRAQNITRRRKKSFLIITSTIKRINFHFVICFTCVCLNKPIRLVAPFIQDITLNELTHLHSFVSAYPPCLLLHSYGFSFFFNIFLSSSLQA